MRNVYVVAQEFKTPGNCGALARVMKNFNFQHLIFLNPKCDYKGKEAIDRATHAKDILYKAEVIKDIIELRKEFDYLVGTTAMVGGYSNLLRLSLTPQQLAQKIAKTKNKIALIFGRENEGMSNKELAVCDFVVTIPTFKEYPVMNVSHAAAVILYEIFKKTKEEKVAGHIKSADKKERAVFLEIVNKTLKGLDFNSEDKLKTQEFLWERIVGKSFLTRRELSGLFGFFKKVKRKIK